MMIDVDPKIKKKKGADYFERPEDLDAEWVKQHQDAEVDEMRQKIIKKFEKDNEKLAAEGEKEMKPKELTDRLEKVEELAAKYKKENKTGKVEAEGKGPTVEKLEANIDKINQRIENMRIQMEDKEGNKEVALGTSKIVSHVAKHQHYTLLTCFRTTSILASPSSSPRSSMSLLRGSSPRRCARSSIGRSSPSTRTGSFRVRASILVFGLVRCFGTPSHMHALGNTAGKASISVQRVYAHGAGVCFTVDIYFSFLIYRHRTTIYTVHSA